MPELPEVEAAAQRLRNVLVGRSIGQVTVWHPAVRRTLPAAAQRALTGVRVERIERRGKIQLLHLEDGAVLEVHFRMTGDWDIGRADDPSPAHERARFLTHDGVRISFVDSRALGVIRRHAPGHFRPPSLGPEPLTDAFTVDVFADALRRRTAPIKQVLLDQQVVAGVGNIYASEALWVARLHPETPARDLTRARLTALRDAIRAVLAAAPSARYYGAADATTDVEPVWQVYDREGESCGRCGRAIVRSVHGARSSYHCPRCQRRPGGTTTSPRAARP